MSQLDLDLAKVLHQISGILEAYDDEAYRRRLDELSAALETKRFQVAVAGEFKRGKSTLINALLGMPVLPTDAEPTTTAVNRIVYGAVPSCSIHYKDGTQQPIPLEALARYVTKRATAAENVREAVIAYPTEICAHHIEIIDTPGLNDDDSMNAVTDTLLTGVDAVVLAVHARFPYSETECRWLSRLLALPRLQYVLCAVTFWDTIRPRERDSVLAGIRHRISENTLQEAARLYADQPALLEKARRLFDPDRLIVAPVAAALALEAFDSGDAALLTESLLPTFKKELFTALNTSQQLSLVSPVLSFAEDVYRWAQTLTPEAEWAGQAQEEAAAEEARAIVAGYFAARQNLMSDTLGQLERLSHDVLWTEGFPRQQIVEALNQCFIRALAAVTDYTEPALWEAIRQGTENAQAVWETYQRRLETDARHLVLTLTEQYLQGRDALLTAPLSRLSLPIRPDTVSREELETAVQTQLAAPLLPPTAPFLPQLPAQLMGQNLIRLIALQTESFLSGYQAETKPLLDRGIQTNLAVLLQTEPLRLGQQLDLYMVRVTENIRLRREETVRQLAHVRQKCAVLRETMDKLASGMQSIRRGSDL